MTYLFCFLLDFGGDARLDFGFSINITAFASNLLRFRLSVLLILFFIFGRWLGAAFIVLYNKTAWK